MKQIAISKECKVSKALTTIYPFLGAIGAKNPLT